MTPEQKARKLSNEELLRQYGHWKKGAKGAAQKRWLAAVEAEMARRLREGQ